MTPRPPYRATQYTKRNVDARRKAEQTLCAEHVYQVQERGTGAGSWRCVHCGKIGIPPKGKTYT